MRKNKTPAKPVLTPVPDLGRVSTSRPVVRTPDPAKRLADGSIWDVDGRVLVDKERFPSLWRAVQTAGACIAAFRSKWSAVEDARRHGHYDEADRLVAPLLGKEPPLREVSVPIDLPGDTAGLVEKLKAAPDKKAASKLRAELRRRGIKGGLRGLRV